MFVNLFDGIEFFAGVGKAKQKFKWRRTDLNLDVDPDFSPWTTFVELFNSIRGISNQLILI